jgi:hypothetical protein
MTVTTNLYNKFIQNVGSGIINLETDTFKVALVGPGYTFDPASELYSQIPGGLPQANGYNYGGSNLVNPTFTYQSTGTKWSADNLAFSATGGDIGPALGAVIYDVTAGNKLCCYINFGTPQTITSGNHLLLYFSTDGIVKFSI